MGAGLEDDGRVEKVQVQLGGVEVFELTSFAQKKVWIDSKIQVNNLSLPLFLPSHPTTDLPLPLPYPFTVQTQPQFLSSLPPISVLSPLPPTKSPTTKIELKEWWEEHDRIEREVDEYDMGDLVKLKKMAKEASKRNLSAKDTDLIEITLSTLFALDRLLHLLRQRRRNLNLLKYRMQWEELSSVAWASHERILKVEMNKFLQAAYWTIPDSPSHPSTPTPLSHSTSSNSFSSSSSTPASSTTTTSSSLTPSTSHRTLSTTLLSLSLSTLRTSLHTLTSTSLPLASSSLDKLIDSSPSALPDPFLDTMEVLEEAVGSLEGVGEWAEGVEEVRRGVERAWEGFERGLVEGRGLTERVRESMRGEWRPDRRELEGFVRELEGLREKLEGMRKRERFKRLYHPLAMAYDVERLEGILRGEEERFTILIDQIRLQLSRYSNALEGVDKSLQITLELEVILQVFFEFLEMDEKLEGRVRLSDGVDFVERRREVEEGEIEGSWDGLMGTVRRHLRSVPLLLQHASKVVVELSGFGVERELMEGIRGKLEEMGRQRGRVEEVLRGEEERRVKLGKVREWVERVRELEKEREGIKSRLREGMERARWREVPSPTLALALENGEDIDIDIIRKRSETASINSLNPLNLIKHHPKLHQHLSSLHSDLLHSLKPLLSMKILLGDIVKQREAVFTVEGKVNEFEKECEEVERSLEEEEMAEGRIDELEKKLAEELIRDVHEKIPFLAGASFNPTSIMDDKLTLDELAPFDLVELDSEVRSYVNTRIAGCSARVDELRRKLEELRHLNEAKRWDEERGRVEGQLEELGQKVEGMRGALEGMKGDTESHHYASFLQEIDSHANTLTPHSASITTLATSLAILSSSPISSSPLFSSHVSRQVDHQRLSDRHVALSSSLEELRTSVEEAHKSQVRREKAEAEARAVFALLQTRAEKLERLVKEMGEVAGRPNLEDESCLVVGSFEVAFDGRLKEVTDAIKKDSSDIEELSEKSNETIKALDDSGSSSPLATQLRQELERLQSAVKAAATAVASAEAKRLLLQEIRSTHASFKDFDLAVAELSTRVMEKIEETRWRAGSEKLKEDVIDFEPDIEILRQRLADLEAGSLASTLSRLSTNQVPLHTHLESLANSSRTEFARLPALLQLLQSVRSQRNSVLNFLAEVRNLDHEISSIIQDVEVGARKSSIEWEEDSPSVAEQGWRRQCASFEERLATFRSSEKIAVQPVAEHLPNDFSSLGDQDGIVSMAVAKEVDDVEDRLFHLHGRLDVFSHHIEAMGWDRELAGVEEEFEASDRELDELAEVLSATKGTGDPSLFDNFAQRLDLHTVDIEQVTQRTTALDQTLASLITSPPSSDPLFSSHESRTNALQQLLQRHAQLSNRFEDLRADSIAAAESCRRAEALREEQRLLDLEAVQEQERLAALEAARLAEQEEQARLAGFEAEKERHTAKKQDRSASPKSVTDSSATADNKPQRPARSLARSPVKKEEPVSHTSSRVAFTSPDDIEDVFGPTLHTNPFPFGEEEDDTSAASLAEIKARLDAVELDHWMDDLSFLPLPTEEDAGDATRQLAWVQNRLDDVASGGRAQDRTGDTIVSLRDELDRKLILSVRVESLASFNTRVEAADAALSDLLTSIDAITPGLDVSDRPSTPTSSTTAAPISTSLLLATESITEARRAAILLIDDGRVEANVLRLEQTLAEINDMIEDLKPRSASSLSTVRSVNRAPSSLSTHSSQTSNNSLRTPASQSPSRSASRQTNSRQSVRLTSSSQSMSRTPSSASFNATTPRKTATPSSNGGSLRTPRARVTSTPISSKGATLPKAFNFSSRTRAVSQRTPGDSRIPEPSHRASTPLGERLRTSLSSRAGQSLANTMEERRLSASFSSAGTTASRRESLASSTRSSFRNSLSTPRDPSSIRTRQSPRFSPPVKRVYKANKKRRVDVEVGRIVNQMPLSVRVRAAEQQSHQDESGMYWIGERLYFVRILRSKTAMVRVGGGWQNLATFLLSHFSDTESIQNLKISPSSTRRTVSSSSSTQDPTWISSATLSASTSSLASSTRSRHSLSMGVNFSPTVRVAQPPFLSTHSNTQENTPTPRTKNIWRP